MILATASLAILATTISADDTIPGATTIPVGDLDVDDQQLLNQASDVVINCLGAEGQLLAGLLTDPDDPVTITALDPADLKNANGDHDQDTIGVNTKHAIRNQYRDNSVAVAAVTVAHEAEHIDGARGATPPCEPGPRHELVRPPADDGAAHS